MPAVGRGRPGLFEHWSDPPDLITLPREDVHVWRVSLADAAGMARLLAPLLSEDEQERAARFRFERHRNAYIASRGTLRRVLAPYLDLSPEQIRFDYGAHGKPSLGGEAAGSGVEFNLSHSGEVALVAVTRGRRVGVDVERIRAEVATDSIARRYFSPREVETLLALPEPVRLEAFFACWCRKEAYLKARGDGLTHPLDAFDVTLAPHERAELLATRDDPNESKRWRLYALNIGVGYAAALAVESPPSGFPESSVRCWQCSPAR